MPNVPMNHQQAADALAGVGRRFYARGWVLGTSGNFSVVTCRDPLRLAITASSVDKGALDAIAHPRRRRPAARSTAAPATHRPRPCCTSRSCGGGAGAVLHTHSVWGTLLSDSHGLDGGLAIEGYEMLKGLDGVRTHEHREWVPIVPNDQDMTRLARVVGSTLDEHPAAHAILLQRHGLYTWGAIARRGGAARRDPRVSVRDDRTHKRRTGHAEDTHGTAQDS